MKTSVIFKRCTEMENWLEMGFLKTTDQPTTYHRPPTNRPTDHRPPISKKFQNQKKYELIFDITYDFKYRVWKIMLCIMHTH